MRRHDCVLEIRHLKTRKVACFGESFAVLVFGIRELISIGEVNPLSLLVLVSLEQSIKIQGSNLFLGTLPRARGSPKIKNNVIFMMLLQNELNLLIL